VTFDEPLPVGILAALKMPVTGRHGDGEPDLARESVGGDQLDGSAGIGAAARRVRLANPRNGEHYLTITVTSE